MSEHEKQKRAELADGVGYAIESLVARASASGEMIWTGDAVRRVLAEFPDAEMSPAELAEAIVRAASVRGLSIAFQRSR